MKKYLFSVFYLMCLTLTAVAQGKGSFDWYDAYSDKAHKQYTTHYMINREAMEFHFDWDSDNEMVMKNYKKSGNTETFDVYYKDRPTQLHAHIVLVIDAATPANSQITYTIKEFEAKAQVQYLVQDNSKVPGSYGGGSGAAGAASPGKSIKDGAKNLMNKGKNLFKKKK